MIKKRINSFFNCFNHVRLCNHSFWNNSFIHAGLYDDRTALHKHYTNILILFYFHVWIDQCQNDDVWINVKMMMYGSMSRWYKKNMILEIWQTLNIWRRLSRRRETEFLFLKDKKKNNYKSAKTQAFCGGERIALFCKIPGTVLLICVEKSNWRKIGTGLQPMNVPETIR